MGDDGVVRSSRQLIYVAAGCSGVFLSQRFCKDLGLISENFPRVGDTDRARGSFRNQRKRSSSEPPLESHQAHHGADTWVRSPPPALAASLYQNKCFEINDLCYGCLEREMPPKPPGELPFEPIEQNILKLKEWIEDRYAASTFNKCEHTPLPMMKGSPPLKLYIDPDIKPVAVHKYAPVPVHFESIVKSELDSGC